MVMSGYRPSGRHSFFISRSLVDRRDGFGESLFGLSSVSQDVRVRAVGDGGRRRVVRRPGRADRERGREEPEHLGNI